MKRMLLILSLVVFMSSSLFAFEQSEITKLYNTLNRAHSKSPGKIELTYNIGGPDWFSNMKKHIRGWSKAYGYNYTIDVLIFAGVGKCTFVLEDETEQIRANCRKLNSSVNRNSIANNTKK